MRSRTQTFLRMCATARELGGKWPKRSCAAGNGQLHSCTNAAVQLAAVVPDAEND
jgi:hypothetical protein